MTTTNYNDVFSQFDLGTTDPNIIIDQSINKLWGMVKDEASLVTLLSTMQDRGKLKRSLKTKTPKWAIGDYPVERGTLAATFAYNATSITLTNKKYFSGDLIYIQENISSAEEWALVRLGAYTSGSYTFNATVIDVSPSFVGTFTVAASVIVLGPAADYDGEARKFLNIKPSLAQNQMQRMRDTVGAGKWERSEEFLADHSLQHLVTLGFRSLQKKINNSIYASPIATSPTGSKDYGILGGLPYSFNPGDVTYADTSGIRTSSWAGNDGVWGRNQVDAGTALDLNNLTEWVEKLTQKGGKDKIVSCSPLMFRKVMAMVRNEISLERPAFMDYNLAFGDVWKMQPIDFGFGTLWFNVDRGATGIPIEVVDDDDSTTTASSLYWMVAIDPMHTGIVSMEVEGEGVQDLQINPVFKERNNSIEEIEIECTKTIVVDDPETGGYYGITNS